MTIPSRSVPATRNQAPSAGSLSSPWHLALQFRSETAQVLPLPPLLDPAPLLRAPGLIRGPVPGQIVLHPLPHPGPASAPHPGPDPIRHLAQGRRGRARFPDLQGLQDLLGRPAVAPPPFAPVPQVPPPFGCLPGALPADREVTILGPLEWRKLAQWQHPGTVQAPLLYRQRRHTQITDPSCNRSPRRSGYGVDAPHAPQRVGIGSRPSRTARCSAQRSRRRGQGSDPFTGFPIGKPASFGIREPLSVQSAGPSISVHLPRLAQQAARPPILGTPPLMMRHQKGSGSSASSSRGSSANAAGRSA